MVPHGHRKHFFRLLPVSTMLLARHHSLTVCFKSNSESKLATTMITLMLATSLLGLCLMVAGRMRLATLVHYLPMPVVCWSHTIIIVVRWSLSIHCVVLR
jgi:hypothetical protein